MREHLRRDGAVVLTGDDGDQDQVIVEGIITAFAPNRDSHCVCGAALQSWHLRHVAEGAVDAVLGRVQLETLYQAPVELIADREAGRSAFLPG